LIGVAVVLAWLPATIARPGPEPEPIETLAEQWELAEA
jgi:hypothetical protein